MSKRKAAVIYTVLILSFILSSVFLALEVKHIRYERTDPLEGRDKNLIPQEQVVEEIKRAEEQEKNIIQLTFENTQAFAPIATPIPRPTATPVPPPTATPVIPANSWRLLKSLGTNMAMMQSFTGDKHYVTVDQVLEYEVNGEMYSFKVLEINFMPSSIKVQDVKTGVTRIIPEEPKAPAPAPRR